MLADRFALGSLFPSRGDLAAMRTAPRADLIAGLTVAIVALPLALGFGAAAGMGPAAGLTTAIIAGLVAALFGGSNLQVSGPAGAMTVVLIPIVAEHGQAGVMLVGAMAGVILLILALCKAGAFIRYIPAPVIEGFTLGTAIVIFLQQLPVAVGMDPDSHHVAVAAFEAVLAFVTHPQWINLLLAFGVAAVILLGNRWWPKVPFSLLAVAAAAIAGYGFEIRVAVIGSLPSTLRAPSLDFIDLDAIPRLLGPAVAVAALAAIAGLLCASVADGMHGTERHEPNRELLGQGLANLASPLFGGMPASAVVARTAVNVRAGAQSRLAAAWHAVILAGFMLFAASLVEHIPLAALAGVLLATTVSMVNRANLSALARSTRSDAIVLAFTTIATVTLDLVMGVAVGLAAAGLVTLVKVAASLRLHVDHTKVLGRSGTDARLVAEHIGVYRLHGPLVFAAGPASLLAGAQQAEVRAAILHLEDVTTVDATGALVLRDFAERLARRDVRIFMSGLREEHRDTLVAVGALERIDSGNLPHGTVEAAIAAARRRLRTIDVP